ncbi:putative TOS1-like glycosyl hydrolase-domain-containing protein [Pseudoneurospora amorphoporcata]|uniref:glucan endo-1,3-beta-D-glucosidase n=1 Tax=Pseudoneurospora amorphoporcata TaxID=241081 RepID=A0AAN6NPB0_9PEZI|nr:putative TOS1-like glycosyl hydrolase-domain-containing protein [Pseudoneurospora amorphoporcata]
MIFDVPKIIAALVAFGALPGAHAFAVGRFGSLSYHGNSTIVARQSDIAPYDTDPAFNPHLNAPDISSDQLCRDHRHQEDIGNWYCQKVDQVIYTKVTKPGTYDVVTFMDNESGACTKTPRQFSGDLAPGGGAYNRIGEYHAATQTRKGVMFLGNRGGAGSGVVSGPFGASLAYSSADGLAGASSPQTIHDAPLVSHSEFVVTTDQPCDDSCGYRRPGAVTYKGFPGSARVFLFEFSMPDEPQHNGDDGNKPAIWLLNSRTPNTAQYFACNCWKSGCGELDVFEVLAPGQDKALSTFHLGDDNKSAGDANYFQRPKGGPIKVALVMDAAKGGTASIKNMGASDGARFGASLSADQVDNLKAKSGTVSEFVYPNH